MKSRYFRHLFQNESDGIVQMGSIWDNALDIETNYVYMAGTYTQNQRGKLNTETIDVEAYDHFLEQGTRLNIMVLGSYTYRDISRMLHILGRTITETVLLPYISPLQRLNLAHDIPNGVVDRKALVYFLDYPYECLRDLGVENIYFLYGNGTPIPGDLDYLPQGHHFEMEDPQIMKLITEMEGQTIPVVKSGYILENQWLFYFGTFGPDIIRMNRFLVERVMGEVQGADVEYARLEILLGKFRGQFGTEPYGSISMFHGPINDNPSESNSLMMGKPFSHDRGCKAVIPSDGKTCALRCQRDYDYEYLQRYKDRSRNRSRMGMWLLGNVNIKKYFIEVNEYFCHIQNKSRAITISNGGKRDFWNPQLLKNMISDDNIYWMLTVEDPGRPEVIMEIITSSAYNRLVCINSRFGYCFSGYLVPRGEEYD